MANTIPTEETNALIASDRVEGTTVYSREGDKLGTVHNFMVNKRSGQVEYAVMSFGGFLGIGREYHPLPWNQLDYDPLQGGYVVNLSREQLEQAPRYSHDREPTFDRIYGQKVYEYYGATYPY